MRSGDFGIQLRRALKHKGMTQKDLAKATGTTRTNISLYIKQNRDPQLDKVIRILKALNMTLEELFTVGKDDKNKESSDRTDTQGSIPSPQNAGQELLYLLGP